MHKPAANINVITHEAKTKQDVNGAQVSGWEESSWEGQETVNHRQN